jgi:hypothetical protein
MVSVAVREQALLLAAADQVTVAEPVPLTGLHVSQEVSVLVALQPHVELEAVNVSVLLTAAAARLAPADESE